MNRMRIVPSTLAAIGLLSCSLCSATTIWHAGADLKAIELPNGNVNELLNPNGDWSYGWRAIVASSSLTLFTSGEHTNSNATGFNNTNLQGWESTGFVNGLPEVTVNVSGGTLAIGTGIPTDYLVTHPASPSGARPFPVVRFTVPTTGQYSLAADWLIFNASASVTVSAVLNGSVIGGASSSLAGATTTFAYSNTSMSLVAGDKLDFVTDAGANNNNDWTAFNATIQFVPEPTAISLLAIGVTAIAFFGRKHGK